MQLNKFKALISIALIVSGLSLASATASAITPSPAMIEQFKQMPKAEQQRLMKQYGISPQVLNGSTPGEQKLTTPVLVNPRDQKELLPAEIQEDDVDHPKQVEKLKPYGYDMFAGEPTTFAPVSDIPIPTNYLLGPGDTINIQIYGKDNQQYSLIVARNGNIQMPDMGPISILGLTFDKIQQQLTKKIQEQYIGVESSISLGELRSIRIIIAGEAYRPGSYTVSSLSTITQALFVSGGISGIGSLRNIQLKRAGKLVGSFDLYDLLMKGDASGDHRLQSGDVIFIPTVGATVGIKGEVRRPAIYELKDGETVAQLIKLAAGLKSNSYPKASLLQTFDANHLPSLRNIDLTSSQGRAQRLKDGDVLNVQTTTVMVKNQIELTGAVTRPGFYQWRQGLRISDLIQSRWTDLQESVDLRYALIAREINNQGDIKVIQFSLNNLFENRNSVDNYALNPRDKLLILSHKESRSELIAGIVAQLKRQVTIDTVTNTATVTGQVRFPGEYPIENITNIKQLIIAAGGLTESAYTAQAELTSMEIDDVEGASVVHQIVNIQAAMDGVEAENSIVVSKDHLHVLKIPNWQESIQVTLKGEVKFPGVYSVRNGEQLDSVIKRAGGYTNDAFLAGAVFTRESVKEQEINQIKKLADRLRLDIASKGLSGQTNAISFTETSQMLTELENLEAVGRMVIALENRTNANNETQGDLLTVEDGDMLYIPSQQQTVTVVGEVQHTSTHFYKNNLSLEQYLTLSGGSKQRADDERIYVIRANGAVMMPQQSYWFGQDLTMQPGDTIVVPLDTEYKDNLTLWTQVTGIIYNTAVAFAAVNGI